MKSRLKQSCAGVLLIAIYCMTFASCNDPQEEPPKPLEVGDESFLEYSLKGSSYWNLPYTYMPDEQVFIVNSDAEMAAYVEGDYPPINFSKCTLLLVTVPTEYYSDVWIYDFDRVADGKSRLELVWWIPDYDPVFEWGPYWAAGILVDKIESDSEIEIDILRCPDDLDLPSELPEKPELSDDYYWADGKKIPIERIDGKYFIMFPTSMEAWLRDEFTKIGMQFNNVENGKEYTSELIDGKDGYDFKTATIEGDIEKITPDMFRYIFHWAPYYRTPKGEERLGCQFAIKLRNRAEYKRLLELQWGYIIDFIERPDKDGWCLLICIGGRSADPGNSLELGNYIYETGQFEDIRYDFGADGCLD